MGSQSVQGPLWGNRSKDWAAVQEPTSDNLYDDVLSHLALTAEDKVLDVGCGSGLFCQKVQATGANVTGLDASEPMLEEARKRTPGVPFLSGDVEDLPFAHQLFDVVTGFNSFQYAANVPNALKEARRVLKDKGKLVIVIWGQKKDCEAASYLAAVGTCMPPPPPGAGGPFALSENKMLEGILKDLDLTILENYDIPSVWDYEDVDTALKGFMSAGPVTRAIAHSGVEKVTEAITKAMQPYIQPSGHVVYHNTFQRVIAQKK
jgi:SAM-dependent methyltransferase